MLLLSAYISKPYLNLTITRNHPGYAGDLETGQIPASITRKVLQGFMLLGIIMRMLAIMKFAYVSYTMEVAKHPNATR
jgi:hypothetical protein